MQVVDSNKEELDVPTIITIALHNMQEAGLNTTSLQAGLLSIVEESSMPGVDMVQFGNTVFLSHRGKDKNKNKMVGRPINVDTGRNYVRNILKFGAHLQKEGITHYSATFTDESLIPAVKIIQKKVVNLDSQVGLGKYEDGRYGIFIKIGEDSLEGLA